MGCGGSICIVSSFSGPQVYKDIHRLFVEYKDARRGPTVILLQSPQGAGVLSKGIPSLEDFPSVHVPAVEG